MINENTGRQPANDTNNQRVDHRDWSQITDKSRTHEPVSLSMSLP